MTTFDDALLVSLPAWELGNVSVESSVFGRETLIGAALTPRLRAALSLIEDRRPADAPLLFVARPEIFTDGATLAWLRARVGAAVDHLAISDGTTLRLLPGFYNHVFFYGLGWRQDGDALARLESRVPEIFEPLDSQVNTALRFQRKGRIFAPKTVVLTRAGPTDDAEIELRRLFLNRHTISDSAARIMSATLIDPADLHFADLTYVRLSERGLRDRALTRQIAAEVASGFVDPTRGAIFVLPQARSAASPLSERLQALAAGLIEGGCRTPLTPAPNMFVATEDLPESALMAISEDRRLVVDDGDDFWRRPDAFYKSFARVTVFAQRRRHRTVAFRSLLSQAYGPSARIAWTSTHASASP